MIRIEKKISKYLILSHILGSGSQGICKKACLAEDVS